MTVLEKRQAIIQKIQQIPDEMLDKIDITLDNLIAIPITLSVEEREEKVKKIIERDFKRYKNVFKALA